MLQKERPGWWARRHGFIRLVSPILSPGGKGAISPRGPPGRFSPSFASFTRKPLLLVSCPERRKCPRPSLAPEWAASFASLSARRSPRAASLQRGFLLSLPPFPLLWRGSAAVGDVQKRNARSRPAFFFFFPGPFLARLWWLPPDAAAPTRPPLIALTPRESNNNNPNSASRRPLGTIAGNAAAAAPSPNPPAAVKPAPVAAPAPAAAATPLPHR